jgi:hypothetical protein
VDVVPKAVGNWSLLNFGNSVNLELDFTDSLADGDSVAPGVTWSCALATGADPTPANRILTPPAQNGNKTEQKFVALNSGSGIIIYLVGATVATTNGESITLWSYVPTAAPGTCLPPGVFNGLC